MTDDTIKITIEYNGKALELSPEDARALYDQLHRMYEVQWLEYKYSTFPQTVCKTGISEVSSYVDIRAMDDEEFSLTRTT